jgi:very-short-patch-repair endonuclease
MPIGRGVLMNKRMKYEEIKLLTKRLRNNPTLAEQKLWRYLRRKQLDGRKFLRQHAIIYETIGNEYYFYVPDFYCFEENLAIELDGRIHLYTKERDKRRDEILNGEGIRVLRFRNEELDDIEHVLNSIKRNFNE